MATLKEKLAQLIPPLREDIRALVTEHGNKVISEVTVGQAYGGMRGVRGMVCDTSFVDPEEGLIIRGIPIAELADRLPEEIWYLLMTGELPEADALKSLQADLNAHAEVPGYVWDVLRAMPADSHPMVMLSVGVLSMERESIFRKRYDEGMKKTDYWEPTYEDSLRLVARCTGVAAGVYRIRFGKGDPIPPKPKLDWGANYAHMLGIPDPTGEFANLMRLYLVLHSDHESGNVSANTCHTVGSALSDVYYAVTAGWNGLAGPLHGLANQECLKFVLDIREEFGGVPSDEELVQFCWDTLNSGKVIPGYGHAVLRATDPRFTSFNGFGKRVCPDDEPFQIVDRMFALVPGVLKEHGKAKNPWPNVDAGSGALLYHFGLTETQYYTVLFAVSRALGMTAYMTINRGVGIAITRPKSVTTDWIKQQVGV
ncbi:type I citrate synthase [candidate division BRC1 bacterium SM23_51]|nr:MAG: type I citrate synthase [candidate division BRC1 bacterium SM23_51]